MIQPHGLSCSFCGVGREQTPQLIGMYRDYICTACILEAYQASSAKNPANQAHDQQCRFCYRTASEVGYMYTRERRSFICSECIGVVHSIVADEEPVHGNGEGDLADFTLVDMAISRIDIVAERRACTPPFPAIMTIVGLIAVALIGLLIYGIYVS